MADQIQWLDGKANVGTEKICPKRHIGQTQWQSKWNKDYETKNAYISDYECIFNHGINNEAQLESRPILWSDLQEAKKQGTKLPITNLVHFTTEENAQAIVASGGFEGGIKKINKDEEGNDVSLKFSWWSPTFDENDRTTVQNTLEQAITPFLADKDDIKELKSQFATSVAFLPTHQSLERYGSYYFQYGINKLCEDYGSLFHGEVQFKILGTFGYKQEVMHAVLVCSQENGAGMFKAYPSVLTPEQDANNEAVVTRDTNGNWEWKPQATGGTKIKRLSDQLNQPYDNYRRWEHVAFAFHIPDEENQFHVDDPESHLNHYELMDSV